MSYTHSSFRGCYTLTMIEAGNASKMLAASVKEGVEAPRVVSLY